MLNLKVVWACCALAASLSAQGSPPNTYLVHYLISDLPGIADHQNASLQNPWVSNNGLSSAAVTATVAPDSPGFLTLGALNGFSYIAAEHADGSLGPAGLLKGVSTTSAKTGEAIALFGTGFGAPAQLASHPPAVLIGGIPAQVVFAGAIAPGLDQINVTVPQSLPDGDAEVVASLGNGVSQPGAFLTVGK